MLWSIKTKFSSDICNIRIKKGLNIEKSKRFEGLAG